jgi:predicted CxxxxCH...CXXCH cytochrome family protein
MGAGATPAVCAKCHPGSDNYLPSHRDGKIKLSSQMNSAPVTVISKYNNQTSAWPQTPSPTTHSCNNVNCHFETDTPIWGSAALSRTTDKCDTCHGAPPSDGRHPGHLVNGNDKHGYLGSGVNSCAYCHSDHNKNSTPEFAHATSASKRPLNVQFIQAPNSGGAYTGNVNYPTYLPSHYTQNPGDKRNGTCTGTYCHSNAMGGPPNEALTWSDTRSSQCYSCHGGRIGDNTQANCEALGRTWKNVSSADGSGQKVGICSPYLNMYSNGHARLVGPNWIRKYACSNCHSDTVTPMENTTSGKIYDGAINRSNHVNGVKNINIAPKWSLASLGKPFLYSPISTTTTKAKTCYNVYCHSDGTRTSKGEAREYSWTQGRTKCNSCHGHPDGSCQSCHDGVKKFVVNNISTVLSLTTGWNLGEEWRGAMPMYQNEGPKKALANSHPKHVGQNFTCDKCHNETVTAGNCLQCHADFSNKKSMTEVAHINPDKHVNGEKNVAFPLQSSTHTRAQYNNDKTCTGTPTDGCHGGSQDPEWGGAINANSVVCIGCHGSQTDLDMPFRGYTQAKFNMDQWATTGHGRPLASGPYPESNNRPANFVTNACMYCHDSTAGKADHPGRGYTNAKNPYRLRVHPQFQRRFEKECVYCHMQGTIAECLGCHSTTETLAPQLASISTARLVTWSNRTATVARPDHRNFNNSSCLTDQGATKCHSGDAWTHNTGPNTLGSWTPEKKEDVKNQYVQMGVCLQCHDDDSNNKCTQCHTSTDPSKYALGFKVDSVFIKPSTARATSAHFGRMHYQDFLDTGGWSKTKTTTKSPGFDTYSAYSGTWKGGKFCWNCHDPHGDSNIYMIHDEVTTSTDAKYGLPLTRKKVSFTKHDTGGDYIVYKDNSYQGICNVCHTNAKHHKQASSDSHNTGRKCTWCHEHKFSDSHGGKDVSGKKNPCNLCHQNRPVPRHSAFGLPRDCTKCHAGIIQNRMDIMRQFRANSHHVQGVVVSNEHCYQCHWEATKLGLIDNKYHLGFNYNNYSTVTGSQVDLVIWGAGIRPTFYSSTSAVTFLAKNIGKMPQERTEAGNVSKHCLGCHSDQNNDTIPFQDCKVPRQYAWDGQSIAARYSQLGTTAWGKYGTNGKSGVTKAFSAHGNAMANQGGYDPNNGIDGAITNTRNGSYNVQCYDCHSSHGSNVGGNIVGGAITTSYVTFNGTRNGGNLKETQQGTGGYSNAYTASKNTTPGVVNPYNTGAGQCFDCHMTPTANQAAAGSVGTPGTPWGYSSTFGASKPIKGYRDGYKFGSRNDSGFPADTFKLTANPMKKDRTTIISGHLKTDAQRTSSSVPPWLNYTTAANNKINGLCTPCHDPHGVSPTLGNQQQYAVPLLKGTWLSSPYKEDQPPPNPTLRPAILNYGWWRNPGPTYKSWGSAFYEQGHSNGSPDPALGELVTRYYTDRNTFGSGKFISEDDQTFAGLCLRCHVQEKLVMKNVSSPDWKSQDRIHRTVKGWGKNTEHAFTCSKCHYPHNSALPRLMQTNCLDYKHRGSVTSGGEVSRAGLQGPGTGLGSAAYADEHRGFPSANVGDRYTDSDKNCHSKARKNTGTWPDNQYWNTKTPWPQP